MSCPSGYTSFLTGLSIFSFESEVVKATSYTVNESTTTLQCTNNNICHPTLRVEGGTFFSILRPDGLEMVKGNVEPINLFGFPLYATDANLELRQSPERYTLVLFSSPYNTYWEGGDFYFPIDDYTLDWYNDFTVYNQNDEVVLSTDQSPYPFSSSSETTYIITFDTGQVFTYPYLPGIHQISEEICYKCESKDAYDRGGSGSGQFNPTTEENPTEPNCDFNQIKTILNSWATASILAKYYRVLEFDLIYDASNIVVANSPPTAPPRFQFENRYGPGTDFPFGTSLPYYTLWYTAQILSESEYIYEELSIYGVIPIPGNDQQVRRQYLVPGSYKYWDSDLRSENVGEITYPDRIFEYTEAINHPKRYILVTASLYRSFARRELHTHCPGKGPVGPFANPEFMTPSLQPLQTRPPDPPSPPPDQCRGGIWVLTLIRFDLQGGLENLIGKIRIPGFPPPPDIGEELDTIQTVLDIFSDLLSGNEPSPDDVRGLYDVMISILSGTLPPRAKEIFDIIWSFFALEPLWHIAGDECNFPVFSRVNGGTYLSTYTTTITISRQSRLYFTHLNRGFISL